MNATTEPQTLDEMAESLLMPETEVEAPDEDQTDTDEAIEEAPEDEAEEVEAEADADEAEEGEDLEEDDADDADTTDSEEPDLYEVPADGGMEKVTLDELKRAYAGQVKIQKGFVENSETRKKLESGFEAIKEKYQQLDQLVTNISQNGLREPVAPDIAQLQNDPIGYMEAKAIYDNERAEYEGTVQTIQAQREQAAQMEQQAQAAFMRKQQEVLASVIPEFSDPEKGTALQKRIRATAIEAYGFADNELSGVTDARQVQVLHDAMRYREMLAKKGEVTAKAAKARPVVKAGAKKTQTPAKAARDKQRQKFAKTGDIQDAIDLMFE